MEILAKVFQVKGEKVNVLGGKVTQKEALKNTGNKKMIYFATCDYNGQNISQYGYDWQDALSEVGKAIKEILHTSK